MHDLTQREQRALQVFQEKEVIHFADLPWSVGYGTMAKLLASGFVETVNSGSGRYSKHFGWRLKIKRRV